MSSMLRRMRRGPSRRIHARIGITVALAMLVGGCTRFVNVHKTDLLKRTEVRRIAILPFSQDLYVERAEEGHRPIVICLYDRKKFPWVTVPQNAFVEVTAGFAQQLQMRTDYELVMPGDVRALVDGHGLDPSELSPPAFFGAIAAGLRVDAVLTGNVLRYDHRRGGRFGAEDPAAVTIDVHLIHAKTGKLLWAASYTETQAALSENMGTFGTVVQRGAQFLTVNQLATWAIEQIVDEFPEPRRREVPDEATPEGTAGGAGPRGSSSESAGGSAGSGRS